MFLMLHSKKGRREGAGRVCVWGGGLATGERAPLKPIQFLCVFFACVVVVVVFVWFFFLGGGVIFYIVCFIE